MKDFLTQRCLGEKCLIYNKKPLEFGFHSFFFQLFSFIVIFNLEISYLEEQKKEPRNHGLLLF